MFGLTEEEFVRNQREMFYDRKVDAALEMAANEAAGLPGNEAAAGAGPAGGAPMLPPEMGGEGGMPGMPPEGEMPPEETQEGDLLASPAGAGPTEAAPTMGGAPAGGEMLPPAKRDDDASGMYPYKLEQDGGQFHVKKEEEEEEDKSKGKHYDPVTLDSRQSGANLRHYSAELGGQLASSSDRNLFKGLSDLKKLASLDSAYSLSEGLSDDKETTYSGEEDKIFQINNETKKLIEGLELKDEKDEA